MRKGRHAGGGTRGRPPESVGQSSSVLVKGERLDAEDVAATGRIPDPGIQYNVKFVSVPDGLGGGGFVPRLFS